MIHEKNYDDQNGHGTHLGSSYRGVEIDFMAPGKSILSTSIGKGYAITSGTSVATALVSGLAALIKAKHIQDEQNNKQSWFFGTYYADFDIINKVESFALHGFGAIN